MDGKRCKFADPVHNGYHCGSYAFNLLRDGIKQGDYCDVHYWRVRCEKAEAAALSQPAAAQVDSSHSAGGECGSVQTLTPGPYSVRKSLAGTGIWHITSPAKQDIGAVRSLADASLFAASGDLLEALEWLVDILPDPELDNDELQRVWTKKARAAIAKATP